MIAPGIVMGLLSTMVWCRQYRDGVHLIKRLNDFFHFDHNIFIVDSAAAYDCWFQSTSSNYGNQMVNDSPPQTVYTLSNIATKLAAFDGISTSKNQLLIVVVARVELGLQFLAAVKSIQALDINVKVGVFFVRPVTSLDIVEQWFHLSWTTGILNIFCAFHLTVNVSDQSDTVFNVFKYSAFDLINVTTSESGRDIFPDKVPNFHGDPLRLEVIREYSNSSIDRTFWDTACDILNASMSKVSVSHKEYFTYGKIIADAFLHGGYLERYSKDMLYPYDQAMLVIVVPHAQPYSDFMAYLQNGTWMLLFVLAFAVVTISSLLLLMSRYLHQKKFFLLQSVSDVVNLLINDNADIKYRNLDRSNVFVIVPLTFTGMIVMNGIVSLFQSYLTSPIYQRQINSLEDLYTSSVPVLVYEVGWKSERVKLLEDLSNYGDWSNKVYGMDSGKLEDVAISFNNSISFFTNSAIARAFLEAQKRLDLKVYHVLSETVFVRYLMTYQVAPEFPFRDALNDLIHRLNSAGLIDKWIKQRDEGHIEMLWKRNLNRLVTKEEDEFSVPTVVWCGWIASAISFICEIIWSRVKSVKRNFLRKVLRK